ncbi:MAG: hypothetical protein ACXVJT_04360 [Thermoanaerobaculia bacterium]
MNTIRSKTMRTLIAAFILAIALTACRNQPAATSAQNQQPTSATAAQSSLTPEQLGELGAQIKKSPNDAQKLLTDRGLTEQSFEQAVRKVAEDPAASKRYTAAYHKAGA